MRPTRRLLWAGAIAGLLFVAAAILVSQLLGEQRVRRELEQRLGVLVGRSVTIRGPLDYEVLPTIAFDVRGIEVADGAPGAAPLAAIERVTGSVRAGSLLSGRIELGPVRVEGVRVALAVDAAGRRNWERLFPEDPAAATANEPPTRWSLQSLALENLAVEYRDARDGSAYAFREASLALGRVELPQPFDVTLRGRAYAGPAERARVELRTRAAVDPANSRYGVEDAVVDATLLPAPQAGATPAPLSLAIRVKRLDYAGSADGTATLRGLDVSALGVRARGELALESLSTAPRAAGTLAFEPFVPREVAGALGVELPPMSGPDALGRAHFASRIAYGAGVVRFDRLQAGLDDTRFTGAVAVTLEPREYRFALAADSIVAGRYLKPKRLRDRRPVELPLDFLRATPVTGRLQVGELEVEGTRLKGVTIDLGDAARGER